MSLVGNFAHSFERNAEATVYVGNVDAKVDEDLLLELMLQVGPVKHIHIPKDKITGAHQGYAFCEYRTDEDAEYSIRVLNMVKLYGKPLRINRTGGGAPGDPMSATKQKTGQSDLGANLFIGNLSELCDEKDLYEVFQTFGHILYLKIMRDPDTNVSRGFAFLSYDTFEAADAALKAMHRQFVSNKQINVAYAYKKDTRGERHGAPAERFLAQQQQTE